MKLDNFIKITVRILSEGVNLLDKVHSVAADGASIKNDLKPVDYLQQRNSTVRLLKLVVVGLKRRLVH